MKYLVKIDRDSIKRNPIAGKTSSIEYVGSEMKFTFSGKSIPKTIKDNWDMELIVNEIVETEEGLYLNGLIHSGNDHLLEQLRSEGVNVQVVHEHLPIKHEPLPDYIFKFEATQVQCVACDNRFKHTDLEEDLLVDGSYKQTLIKNICPFCKTSDCCELEYENISDVIN